MALKQQLKNHEISEQEYLQGELISEIKHELINGDVYAMVGASANHGRISGNLFARFLNHLKNTSCEPFLADMKVKVAENFFYPDIIVSCEHEQNEYYRSSPLIIVEVLSKSTRKKDHTLKRLSYQSLPSLKEYILIEQDFVDIEVCRRDNHWQSEHYFLADEVCFSAIDLRLPVEEVYARVVNEELSVVYGDNKYG